MDLGSRTSNSAKNLASSISITLVMTLLGFITRKVFVDNIGIEYLGLNGLLTNILGIMSLVEGGFGASVVYNLYKPIANDDKPKILALLQLYKRVYRWIAIVVIAMATCLYPFLPYFIKGGEHLQYVGTVYWIFVFNSVINYFVAYKWSLINASQKAYKLTGINLIYQIGLSITKLAILYFTRNYILYLVIEGCFNAGLSLAFVWKANSMFPFIKTKKRYEVEHSVKRSIISNMKALIISNIGGYFQHGTDNILISSFVNVATVGLYSNYTLISGLACTMANQVLGSFTESVGNLIATENSDNIYDVWRTTFFINFLTISIPSVLFINALNPLIDWWLGRNYVMSMTTVGLVIANFYIEYMRNTAMTFRVKAGLFRTIIWSPISQGCINLVLSLIFVQFWGIDGVLLGTTISLLSLGFWQFPRVCYTHIFKKPLRLYFKTYAIYTCVATLACGLSYLICVNINVNSKLARLLLNGFVTLFVTLLIYFITFRKTYPYQQLMTHIKTLPFFHH
jgi:O-antigen/teichoic acid export membrane protein